MNNNEIEFNDACKIALDYYKFACNATGLSEAKDLGDKWLFYQNGNDIKFGESNITVIKKDGNIERFNLPNKDNFKLLENAKTIDIPSEFR